MREYVVFLVILILLSAIFAASETALTALGRARAVKCMNDSLSKIGKKAWKKWMDFPQYTLTVILIGNNIVNIVASAISTKVSLMLFPSRGISIAVGVASFAILTFGEIMPKGLAINYSERIASLVMPGMYILGIVLYPVVRLLTMLSFGILSVFGVKVSSEVPFVTMEDLRNIISEEGSVDFEEEERRMIRGVIEFRDLIVREIMVPRTDVSSIEISTKVRDAIEFISKEGYSRFPVYEDSLDNIKGILYVKDLVKILGKPEFMDYSIDRFMREPFFVPETKKVKELFEELRARKLHIAVVVDEFGGTAGIVTMEDILEEIVGNIEDEFDKENQPFKILDDTTFLVDARLNLDDLSELLRVELPKKEEFDTVGGFLLGQFGKIPVNGDILVYNNVEFEVVDATANRIKRVKVRLRKESRDEKS